MCVWEFALLLKAVLNRGIQRQLKSLRPSQELDKAGLLVTPERPSPRHPTPQDLSELRFLNAIFHETMRCFPPTPIGTARKLPKDMEIAGTKLPKGTPVLAPTWPMHRNVRVWGPDAKHWRPERWLNGRSITAVRKDDKGALRWMPFSDGVRNCLGQQLATARTLLRICPAVAAPWSATVCMVISLCWWRAVQHSRSVAD